MKFWIIGAAAIVLSGCAPEPPVEPLSELTKEFVYRVLSESPVLATQAGYHQHEGTDLDGMLDDYSEIALDRQRRWYKDIRLRLLRSTSDQKLSPDEDADLQLIQNHISRALLELDSIRNYRHNPTIYVELIGTALYTPFVLEYTDKHTRYTHIIRRLAAVPGLLMQARRNLTSAPEVWTRVALEENAANIALIEGLLQSNAPADIAPGYRQAAGTAVAALKDFNYFLRQHLLNRTRDWRLGRDLYAQKFRYTLNVGQTPEQTLQDAFTQMRGAKGAMAEQARKILPGFPAGDDNELIRAALNSVANRHATPDTYFSDARRDLAETTAFVQQADLLTLPPSANLQVVETPEFMRGVYAVGGFNPAPALQPQLGAFYWLTPLPPEWPQARIESKLREYNYYSLKLLTIHEAMPGHYVQFEFANRIEPPLRRLLRGIFGNGPYVEGWAVYATEAMLESGYLGSPPELRITFLKQQLRVFANAILDVELQRGTMSDEQALSLMIDDAFQEREEAVAKLQRAKLSSAQLPTYFVGWNAWWKLRTRVQRQRGSGFNNREFHDAALNAGAVPMPALSKILTGEAL